MDFPAGVRQAYYLSQISMSHRAVVPHYGKSFCWSLLFCPCRPVVLSGNINNLNPPQLYNSFLELPLSYIFSKAQYLQYLASLTSLRSRPEYRYKYRCEFRNELGVRLEACPGIGLGMNLGTEGLYHRCKSVKRNEWGRNWRPS